MDMKARKIEEENEWEHMRPPFFWSRHRRPVFGFWFWIGILLIVWGAFGILKIAGYLKDVTFPFWEVLIILVGLSIVLKRF